MNIFTAFNDNFVLPTRVMLKSLIMNNQGPLSIFVFYSSLKHESIDTIKKLEEKDRVTFCFQKVEDSFLDGVEIPDCYSKETYYRLFAHRLFAEDIERVLWLDGDMIITGPLTEFYTQDFKGKLYAAVEDSGPEYIKPQMKKLNMPADSRYVNTGVLLLNLKEMRKELNEQEIIQYLTDNQEILLYPDQDVINGLLHDRILVVDPNRIYNFFARKITDANKREVYANVRVIHYCGGGKPWRCYNPLYLAAGLWWKYARLTGSEYNRLFRELKTREWLKKSARTILPQPIYNHLRKYYHSKQ